MNVEFCIIHGEKESLAVRCLDCLCLVSKIIS